MQVASPIMHCRDLNPYVASALADWKKIHMQNAHVPRGATALPCATATTLAGV